MFQINFDNYTILMQEVNSRKNWSCGHLHAVVRAFWGQKTEEAYK